MYKAYNVFARSAETIQRNVLFVFSVNLRECYHAAKTKKIFKCFIMCFINRLACPDVPCGRGRRRYLRFGFNADELADVPVVFGQCGLPLSSELRYKRGRKSPCYSRSDLCQGGSYPSGRQLSGRYGVRHKRQKLQYLCGCSR